MRIDGWFRRLSLKTELISSYLVILGIGGLVTSLVGSWIVSSTIMMQARRAVDHDLATARAVYEQRLQELELPVSFAASSSTVERHLGGGDRDSLVADLERIRGTGGFDFLGVSDGRGRVIARVTRAGGGSGDVSAMAVVRAAMEGKEAAGTEILSPETIRGEEGGLLARTRFHLESGEQIQGMALVAAAPVREPGGRVTAVLYGGVLLARNFGIADRVSDLLFNSGRDREADNGSVAIFQADLRIATNMAGPEGERPLATRAAGTVGEAVLGRGEIWRGRTRERNDWYISAYEPIRDYAGKPIGMLSVGLREYAYTAIRNRVILSFFGIATLGFILISAITYHMIRNITRPLGEMVGVTRNIAAGRFDQEVQPDAPGEIALLAEAFNAMLKSLRQMKSDLEDWGRTLEEKVRQRTEELVAMQARVAQSERLASLGMLAAGVAHEVNNPLGGILALTALTLEDMRADDPNRENLEEVIHQTERCRGIVKGLLEFSRQSKSYSEPLDLNKIVEDTLSLVGRQALFFNVTVVKRLDSQLPAVNADRSQFQQVIINILMNAVQAMEERGTITIVTRHDAAGHVELAISDTGRGIPPDQVDRIFDPFFTTKSSGQGTGLGLSIAYGIVTTHKGTISVESEVGKGTTFTVRMPAAEVPEGAQV